VRYLFKLVLCIVIYPNTRGGNKMIYTITYTKREEFTKARGTLVTKVSTFFKRTPKVETRIPEMA